MQRLYTAGLLSWAPLKSLLSPVQYFSVNGVSATIVPLPTMEANKDFELVFELARRMEEFKLNRWDSFRIAGILLMTLQSSICLLSQLGLYRVCFALSARLLPACLPG